jgi:hypothetical protein
MPHALASQTRKHLEYWNGPVDRHAGFGTVIVYCLGPPGDRSATIART